MSRLDADGCGCIERVRAALWYEPAADHRNIIINAAMIATMTTAMTAMCTGLDNMCRTMAKRVPSGRSAMPHFGQAPGVACRTVWCMGHV